MLATSKVRIGLAESGDQTIARTIITCWHTTAVAILVSLQGVDITISEIMWCTTGGITGPNKRSCFTQIDLGRNTETLQSHRHPQGCRFHVKR